MKNDYDLKIAEHDSKASLRKIRRLAA